LDEGFNFNIWNDFMIRFYSVDSNHFRRNKEENERRWAWFYQIQASLHRQPLVSI
jgi:hypothetical protein